MRPRSPLPPYPNGWYAIAFSSELAPRAVLGRRCIGEEVVLFRTEQGDVSVLDAYCPHMGANLAHGGTVQDGLLRCPFHGFRFDRSGACVHAYGGKPPRANTKSYPVVERNGAIFVWHHESGEAPSWEVPALSFDGWTDVKGETIPIRTHVQETAENSVDIGHFAAVHGYTDTIITREAETRGPLLTIGLSSKRSLASVGMPGEVSFVYDIEVWGLGCSIVHVDVLTFGMKTRQLVYATPIDADTIELRIGASVQKLPDEGATANILAMVWDGFRNDVLQDVPIWENKRYVERPPLAAGDGPVPLYRKWAQQFYAS
jgi:phenylpropionate dioxygenase-like ring-hydroxylating dioxygenase large terminal subunit